MGEGQAWESRSELPTLQPTCVVATFFVSDGYSAHRFDRLHWLRSVGFRVPPVVSEPQRPVLPDGCRSGSVRRPAGGNVGLSVADEAGLSAGGALPGARLDELDWDVPSYFAGGHSVPPDPRQRILPMAMWWELLKCCGLGETSFSCRP